MASPITASSTIDVQAMVSSLMQVERRPLVKLQSDAARVDVKISAWGQLQSRLAAFRDAAASLTQLDTWRATKATSGNPSAVEVSASAGAAATQHTIEVTQLAQSQTVTSAALSGADAVIGGGTLRIQLGTQPTGPTSFTPDAGRPEVAVAIPAGSTLAEVRDAINAAGAGVRASIVRDGDQVRLFLSGATSGGDQAFRMLVDDGDGTPTDPAGLSAIAFDPAAAAGAGRNLSLVRAATDAEYTIDGVALTARGNRVAGAMDGVDLVFKQVTTAPVQIDITNDVDALQASTQKFVDAYNSLNALLSEQTRYDSATKVAGALQGDSSAVGIMAQVRSIVRETVSGGSLTRLGDAGMELQRDGSLLLKSSTFRSAATDPTRLESLFAALGTNETDRGLMQRFRDLGARLLDNEGAVKNATDSWAARKANITKRQESLENRLTDVEKRLLRQYSSLDAQLASAQAAGAQLQSALAGLPKLG